MKMELSKVEKRRKQDLKTIEDIKDIMIACKKIKDLCSKGNSLPCYVAFWKTFLKHRVNQL